MRVNKTMTEKKEEHKPTFKEGQQFSMNGTVVRDTVKLKVSKGANSPHVNIISLFRKIFNLETWKRIYGAWGQIELTVIRDEKTGKRYLFGEFVSPHKKGENNQ